MVYGYVEGTYMQQDMSITQNKYFTWNNGKKADKRRRQLVVVAYGKRQQRFRMNRGRINDLVQKQ